MGGLYLEFHTPPQKLKIKGASPNHPLILDCMEDRSDRLGCSVIANCFFAGRKQSLTFTILILIDTYAVSMWCFLDFSYSSIKENVF